MHQPRTQPRCSMEILQQLGAAQHSMLPNRSCPGALATLFIVVRLALLNANALGDAALFFALIDRALNDLNEVTEVNLTPSFES